MAAGATFEPIATTTLGSTATEVSFTSISGSYTDLVLVSFTKASTTDAPGLLCQVNSDTGSNYSGTFLYGNGSAAGSNRLSSQTQFVLARQYGLGDSTTNTANFITQFQNYSNATTYKTIINRSNTPGGSTYAGVESSVGLWRSTSAITSIRIFVNAGGFASGSMFTLYGIKSA
jgi:hypothetical protein